MMMEYDKIYPEYGFAKHKGYGTKMHNEAILTYGPCPIHRRTFFEEAAGRGSRDAGDEITERELNGRKRLSSSWKFIQPPCHRN